MMFRRSTLLAVAMLLLFGSFFQDMVSGKRLKRTKAQRKNMNAMSNNKEDFESQSDSEAENYVNPLTTESSAAEEQPSALIESEEKGLLKAENERLRHELAELKAEQNMEAHRAAMNKNEGNTNIEEGMESGALIEKNQESAEAEMQGGPDKKVRARSAEQKVRPGSKGETIKRPRSHSPQRSAGHRAHSPAHHPTHSRDAREALLKTAKPAPGFFRDMSEFVGQYFDGKENIPWDIGLYVGTDLNVWPAGAQQKVTEALQTLKKKQINPDECMARIGQALGVNSMFDAAELAMRYIDGVLEQGVLWNAVGNDVQVQLQENPQRLSVRDLSKIPNVQVSSDTVAQNLVKLGGQFVARAEAIQKNLNDSGMCTRIISGVKACPSERAIIICDDSGQFIEFECTSLEINGAMTLPPL